MKASPCSENIPCLMLTQNGPLEGEGLVDMTQHVYMATDKEHLLGVVNEKRQNKVVVMCHVQKSFFV